LSSLATASAKFFFQSSPPPPLAPFPAAPSSSSLPLEATDELVPFPFFFSQDFYFPPELYYRTFFFFPPFQSSHQPAVVIMHFFFPLLSSSSVFLHSPKYHTQVCFDMETHSPLGNILLGASSRLKKPPIFEMDTPPFRTFCTLPPRRSVFSGRRAVRLPCHRNLSAPEFLPPPTEPFSPAPPAKTPPRVFLTSMISILAAGSASRPSLPSPLVSKEKKLWDDRAGPVPVSFVNKFFFSLSHMSEPSSAVKHVFFVRPVNVLAMTFLIRAPPVPLRVSSSACSPYRP